MREGPEGLPISFYSVVLKKAAVAARFPGGLAGLDDRFGVTRQNDALALLVSMSASDAAHIVNELETDDTTRYEIIRRLFYLITIAAEDAAALAVGG